MLTRMEVQCAKCNRDLLVDVGEYTECFLGKKGMDRVCRDCKDLTMNTSDQPIDRSATELLRLLKSGPFTDERVLLALKVAWNNGYAQAVREQIAKLQAEVPA